MNDHLTVIADWRKEHNLDYGFVLVYGGKVVGWKAEISRPWTVCPGTHAYGIDGSEFVAEDGDETSGAMTWTPIQCLNSKLGVASQSV